MDKDSNSASWRARMNIPEHPRVVPLTANVKQFAPGLMLIPTPVLIESLVRTIPKGHVLTVGQLRRILATGHQAATSCPLRTSLYLDVVARAAEEAAEDGEVDIAPYWRVLKDDGSLNPKLNRPPVKQQDRLAEDGISPQIIRNKIIVPDFEQRLFY
jgi:alkylated DNA nucleotide flippase Atl1